MHHYVTRPRSYLSFDVDFEHLEEESEPQPVANYTRTQLLVLDYKQFIAARRIQTAWRGHSTRKLGRQRWEAAITIQRWWRGFQVRQRFACRMEQRLQQALLDHYNEAATKIQALFRGWWVRQTVHDMHSLYRMQLCAAEELLSCVAQKLHYLLRTYSIPGVYSLRNSHCLSRVEKLLSSMNYRFHNDRMRFQQARKAAIVAAQRREYNNAFNHTKVPFPGPNYLGICEPACDEWLRSGGEMDRRMYQIIAEYEKSAMDKQVVKVHRTLAERKLRRHIEEVLYRQSKEKHDFCGDVIRSMRKWKIWQDNQITISTNVFRTPELLQSFLDEVSELWEEMEGNCHCGTPLTICR
ncbi:CG13544 [Drosophila busckii]|uniref:CG13544 n=1 Tax=Drosophila busckii TaxID=30019 RepID=A0A0M5J1Y5_DROBS|nr:CG13544 [Drosophila busckii]